MYVALREFPGKELILVQIFAPHFAIIALRSAVASQGIMDDTGQQSYRFHTDRWQNHLGL